VNALAEPQLDGAVRNLVGPRAGGVHDGTGANLAAITRRSIFELAGPAFGRALCVVEARVVENDRAGTFGGT
jgi:hypothetical protein